MSLLVTGTLFFAGRELLSPSRNPAANKKAIAATNTASNKLTDDSPVTAVFSGLRPPAATASARTRKTDSGSGGQDYSEITITISHPVIRQPDLTEYLSRAVQLPATAPAIPVTASLINPGTAATANPQTGSGTQDASASLISAGAHTPVNPMAAGILSATNPLSSINALSADPLAIATAGLISGKSGNSGTAGSANPIVYRNNTNTAIADNLVPGNGQDIYESAAGLRIPLTSTRSARVAKHTLSLSETTSGPEVSGDPLQDPAGVAARNNPLNTLPEAQDQQRINWLQEYALYNLEVPAKRGRKYWQLYVTPTATWRSYSGGDFSNPKDGNQYSPGVNSAARQVDPSSMVDHGPALGFTAGGNLLYRVTRNLSVKVGLQFSFSRLTLHGYSANTTHTGRSINTLFGAYADSLNALIYNRQYRTENEFRFTNDFFQLSAPIGFELRLLGNERLQWHVGASVMPTWLISPNAWMLSPDYTRYTKDGPSMYRRWNMNAEAETFLSYRLGSGLRLQAGPVFRYQILSSYNSLDFLKEYQKGYGIRIGVTKAF